MSICILDLYMHREVSGKILDGEGKERDSFFFCMIVVFDVEVDLILEV